MSQEKRKLLYRQTVFESLLSGDRELEVLRMPKKLIDDRVFGVAIYRNGRPVFLDFYHQEAV